MDTSALHPGEPMARGGTKSGERLAHGRFNDVESLIVFETTTASKDSDGCATLCPLCLGGECSYKDAVAGATLSRGHSDADCNEFVRRNS